MRSHRGSRLHRAAGGECRPDLARPGYPGEKHGIIIDPGPCFGIKGNYLGPATHYEERMARGDRGINDLDEAARVHDGAYNDNNKMYDVLVSHIMAQFNRDGDTKARDARLQKAKGEYIDNSHKADRIFRDKARNSKDAPITGKIASTAIAAKQIGEVSGLIPTKLFSGRGQPQPAHQPSPSSSSSSSSVEEEEELPAEHLRQMFIKQEKKANKMVGGFIPLAPLAIGVVSAAAGELVGKLFDKIFSKKSGSGPKMTVQDKKDAIIEAINENPKVAEKVLKHVSA